jgi:hypothetical protein
VVKSVQFKASRLSYWLFERWQAVPNALNSWAVPLSARRRHCGKIGSNLEVPQIFPTCNVRVFLNNGRWVPSVSR